MSTISVRSGVCVFVGALLALLCAALIWAHPVLCLKGLYLGLICSSLYCVVFCCLCLCEVLDVQREGKAFPKEGSLPALPIDELRPLCLAACRAEDGPYPLALPIPFALEMEEDVVIVEKERAPGSALRVMSDEEYAERGPTVNADSEGRVILPAKRKRKWKPAFTPASSPEPVAAQSALPVQPPALDTMTDDELRALAKERGLRGVNSRWTRATLLKRLSSDTKSAS